MKMDTDERDAIVAAIREKAVLAGGREKLSCAAAFAIADTHGVGRREIGNICNDLGILIGACQLGCFS